MTVDEMKRRLKLKKIETEDTKHKMLYMITLSNRYPITEAEAITYANSICKRRTDDLAVIWVRHTIAGIETSNKKGKDTRCAFVCLKIDLPMMRKVIRKYCMSRRK